MRPSFLFHFFVRPALLCALATLVHAADPLELSLSNQSPAQCDTLDISWSGGTPDYTIVITSQLTPTLTTPAEVFANLTNSSIPWTADKCGGALVYVIATDGTGEQTNITFTLGLSANMSCLPDQERSSAQCLAESASLHLPSATASSSPNAAPRELGSLTMVPLMLALVLAGAAFCVA